MKIVLLDGYALNHDLDWQQLDRLGEFDHYDRTSVDNDEEILQRIGQTEIVLTHKTPLNDRVISQAPRLRYIGIMGTGYDAVDIQSADRNHVAVTNVPTYATDAVAQFTFALLLEVTSQVGLHNRLVHEGKWLRVPDFTFWDRPLFELQGKTLGLIGYGHIAEKVAELGHTFAMKVIFYNHRPKKDHPSWVEQVDLDELLTRSDVISLHTIQTPDTVNLINRSSLQKMKKSAILLNTARGKLVNEADLAEALNRGDIDAFATDVVGTEPISADNPLLKAKNCYITPHIAWAPFETRRRLLDISISNLANYLSGKPSNLVHYYR
ncbi:D-2-hydroxyacid dehydrogenase [Oenococcus kitaharae]|uniref:D-2-hydroxyacid dehydrogenase n=1 Tax=Oenococcus TaxID=46254 RepID=UPI0021E85B46|nr:D-2-hydroxyacid dehydrogenase [Oenococcus kitaharae]MCV3296883.1 D-2-hydroxyacid dehydrogenase [Oenococcus kitaharae]